MGNGKSSHKPDIGGGTLESDAPLTSCTTNASPVASAVAFVSPSAVTSDEIVAPAIPADSRASVASMDARTSDIASMDDINRLELYCNPVDAVGPVHLTVSAKDVAADNLFNFATSTSGVAVRTVVHNSAASPATSNVSADVVAHFESYCSPVGPVDFVAPISTVISTNTAVTVPASLDFSADKSVTRASAMAPVHLLAPASEIVDNAVSPANSDTSGSSTSCVNPGHHIVLNSSVEQADLVDVASPVNVAQLHNPSLLEQLNKISYDVQLTKNNHKEHLIELSKLYNEADPITFVSTLSEVITQALSTSEGKEQIKNTVIFYAKFISKYSKQATLSLPTKILTRILTTAPESQIKSLQFPICHFIRLVLVRSSMLHFKVFKRMLKYLLVSLQATSPGVREQAILAMRYLQIPEYNDRVLSAYKLHLSSDSSPFVRQAVVKCMKLNLDMIPNILNCLRDTDEEVRRLVYMRMSSYSMQLLTVPQRFMLLQQGLDDCSETVQISVSLVLKEWLKSFQNDIIAFISSLKTDDIQSFQKLIKRALKVIFEQQSKNDLLMCMPLQNESGMLLCVQYEQLTLEVALYWQCLLEHFQANIAEELNLILPQLSTFCKYVEAFCETQTPEVFEELQIEEFEYKTLILLEIFKIYDTNDATEREILLKSLAYLLRTCQLEETSIEFLVRCAENLIANESTRLQFFIELIEDICCFGNKKINLLSQDSINTDILCTCKDTCFRIRSLLINILELEVQKASLERRKEYLVVERLSEKISTLREELSDKLQPVLDQHPNPERLKETLKLCRLVKQKDIVKGLRISFYIMSSPTIGMCNSSICNLYDCLISCHITSADIETRTMALRCAAVFSLLYEEYAKDVFKQSLEQFYKSYNIRLWEVAITTIFDLVDKYGLTKFVVRREVNKQRNECHKSGNSLDLLNIDSNDFIALMLSLLHNCTDMCIISAVIEGFCRLILFGLIDSRDVMETLLVSYFSPRTDQKITEILLHFFEELKKRKKLELLLPCLITMLSKAFSVTQGNSLWYVRPETVMRFFFDLTLEETSGLSEDNMHNLLAIGFLKEIRDYSPNKALCKFISNQLLSLKVQVGSKSQIGDRMIKLADEALRNIYDQSTKQYLCNFKNLLKNSITQIQESRSRPSTPHSKTTFNPDDSTDSNQSCNLMSGQASNAEVGDWPPMNDQKASMNTNNEEEVTSLTSKMNIMSETRLNSPTCLSNSSSETVTTEFKTPQTAKRRNLRRVYSDYDAMTIARSTATAVSGPILPHRSPRKRKLQNNQAMWSCTKVSRASSGKPINKAKICDEMNKQLTVSKTEDGSVANAKTVPTSVRFASEGAKTKFKQYKSRYRIRSNSWKRQRQPRIEPLNDSETLIKKKKLAIKNSAQTLKLVEKAATQSSNLKSETITDTLITDKSNNINNERRDSAGSDGRPNLL